MNMEVSCRGMEMDSGSVCILVVDDEEFVLDVGTRVLIRMGYRVLGARSGVEAVATYQENKEGIDLVLLDYNLSGEKGADVFKSIRKINPNAAVVITTGFGENQEILELMNLGCRGFIQKPYGLDALAEKINSALRDHISIGLPPS
jgi:two-component system cell cycle sensor histidine kinase/response regulator CckA